MLWGYPYILAIFNVIIKNRRSLHPPCQDCVYKATEGRGSGNLARDGEEVPEVPES